MVALEEPETDYKSRDEVSRLRIWKRRELGPKEQERRPQGGRVGIQWRQMS